MGLAAWGLGGGRRTSGRCSRLTPQVSSPLPPCVPPVGSDGSLSFHGRRLRRRAPSSLLDLAVGGRFRSSRIPWMNVPIIHTGARSRDLQPPGVGRCVLLRKPQQPTTTIMTSPRQKSSEILDPPHYLPSSGILFTAKDSTARFAPGSLGPARGGGGGDGLGIGGGGWRGGGVL